MDRSFYIEHLGCAKNRVDASSMSDALESAGWREIETPGDADLIIVNTCGFIETAKQESIDTTLGLKDAYPGKRVILAGCLSQRYAEELGGSLSEIDGVFGNRNPARILDVVAGLDSGERPTIIPSASGPAKRSAADVGAATGYLKIAEGCNNRCTFCAIPLIRGSLESRNEDDIVDDVRRLLDSGVFEINLIGQDIASYGTDRPGDRSGRSAFISLLERILEVSEPFWLRLLYIHPDHFPRELLSIVATEQRLLPYFDIPVQHGSDRILSAMGRAGTGETYLALFDSIRNALSNAIIRSTFLVGFPGERRQDRDALLEFQARASIDWLGVFEYSPEEGTAAYRRLSSSARKSAGTLRHVLEERQSAISAGRMDRFVDTEFQVLVEEPVGDGLAIGRGFMHAPEVDGNVVIHGEALEPGTVHMCRVFRRNGIDLEGKRIDG